ncbi:SDR family oxidoreductase [Pseudarthrobacter defluvii]|uniref:SDR family oxidoreductase n=1 Tax=Pseudarthrobacter defluvii TaxID=410837 RepID=UPI0027D80C08|nr:SDR family oxidoreductase [Pseudarthrobacter defluvii]
MTGSKPARVLVTGGSGASGIAVARALASAGHRVATVGSDQARIRAAAKEAGDGVTPFTCDLADFDGVRQLREQLSVTFGSVDAVIHLVGGWRGAKGISDQSDDDWDFLERGAVTTLRNVSRVFFDDIAASTAGRFAMVSSTAVDKPAAAVASYVAAKAAAEAWTMAMADGFRRISEAGGGNAAATVLVVKALVDDELRRAHPERKFPGATDVADLAAAVVRLFGAPSTELNGARLRLAD